MLRRALLLILLAGCSADPGRPQDPRTLSTPVATARTRSIASLTRTPEAVDRPWPSQSTIHSSAQTGSIRVGGGINPLLHDGTPNHRKTRVNR
jgi:hypothetical protein